MYRIDFRTVQDFKFQWCSMQENSSRALAKSILRQQHFTLKGTYYLCMLKMQLKQMGEKLNMTTLSLS